MEKIEFKSAYINPYAPPALGGAGPQSSVSVEYEVYGQVQGCNFPRYLKEVCDMRGLGGWVKNSKSGTIMGKLQGPRNRVDEVIHWLQNTGSPGSKIERVNIKNWELLERQDFRNFSIRF